MAHPNALSVLRGGSFPPTNPRITAGEIPQHHHQTKSLVYQTTS
jgi:hypothetical protein